MEKINKPPLPEISELKKLEENWEKWGIEGKKWKSSGKLYLEIRKQLEKLTLEHCSFCDDYPIGANSTETVEHYFPKKEYFCFTYYWENLFYCCTKCQSEANKYSFEYTLKPDNTDYLFEDYFYYHIKSGELRIIENLEESNPDKYLRAKRFLERYNINKNRKRIAARKATFSNVLNKLKIANPDDLRTRNDFEFRYVYDEAKRIYEQQIKQK